MGISISGVTVNRFGLRGYGRNENSRAFYSSAMNGYA